jgi:hypothetical protein
VRLVRVFGAFRVGVAAVFAIVLMVVGLLLYGVADVRVGGWVALAGLLLAFGAIAAAEAWPWRHGDDDFG